MTEKDQRLRGFLLAVILPAVLLVVSLSIPMGAAGAPYLNADRHYSVEVPAGWTAVRGTIPGVSLGPDWTFEAPNFANDTAFFYVVSITDPQAENTSDYVLKTAAQVRQALVQGSGGSTSSSELRSLMIASRPAADFTVGIPFGAGQATVHVVTLSSEYHKLTYAIQFYARAEVADSYRPTWDTVANSFRVTDEGVMPPPSSHPNSPLSYTLLPGVVAAALVVIPLVFVLARRKKRATGKRH